MRDDLYFWKHVLIKGFVSVGITFFAVCASIGFGEALVPSLIAGGSYIFLEAGKYYGLQPERLVGDKTYTFII